MNPTDLTIATVVYNARDGFVRTLRSVADQKTDGVEYVVVDGGSSDGTLEIVRAQSRVIDTLVSEHDRGIYDAMNKAIRKARGDSIMFLNAGDTLTDGAMAILLASARSTSDIDCHTVNICEGDRVVRLYMPQPPPDKWDRQHMYLPHPGMVVKRRVFDKIGIFDDSLHSAADLDWMNRVIADRSLCISFSTRAVVNFRLGGVSASVSSARETRDVAVRHGKSPIMANIRYVKTCIRHWVARKAAAILSMRY